MDKNKIEELEIASKPLVDYVNKYLCPHDCIIVEQGSVKILCGEVSIPTKILD